MTLLQFRNTNKKKGLIKGAIVAVILSLAGVQQQAEAQQMFVDDAAVTTERSFQVETWYGSRESWFLAAISPLRWLEIGAGLGVDTRDGFDPSNWILEAKFVLRDFEEAGSAIGLVSGILHNLNGDLEEFFAYIPYSRMILDESLALHFNVGFDALRQEEWQYELITGIRGDFGISGRFTLLGEVAAANFGNAFYQGGIRITLLPDLLEMDITYGEGFRRQETAPGFNVGIAFTPDTLW